MTAGAPSSFLTSVSVGAAQTITGDKTFTGTSTFSGDASFDGDVAFSGDVDLSQLLRVAPAAATSGVRVALSVTGAADTGITASTEQPDVLISGARTLTWATGALTNQRTVYVTAPTLAFAAASTVTNASTVYIDRAPQAGTNATLTNAYSLFVDAGRSRFDGPVVQNDYPVLQTTGTIASPVTTINTPAGVTVVANGATSVSVTCAACTTSTLITGVILNATTNNVSIRAIIPGSGSFVVHVTGDPGVSTAVIGVRISQAGSGT